MVNKMEFKQNQLLFFPIRFDRIGACVYVTNVEGTNDAICLNLVTKQPFKINKNELFPARRTAHLYSLLKKDNMNLYYGDQDEVFVTDYRFNVQSEIMGGKDVEVKVFGRYFSSDNFCISKFETDKTKAFSSAYLSTVNTTKLLDGGYGQPVHVWEVVFLGNVFDNFMN